MLNYPNFRSANLKPGQSLGNLVQSVSLTADNQVINPLLLPRIRISSDNTTASNRTFTLTNGAEDGQILYLVLISGASSTCELATSANCVLSATWTPLINDALTLMWDAQSVLWREIGRADVA